MVDRVSRKISRWTAIGLAVTAVLMILLFALSRGGLRRSWHKDPPSEDIVCLMEQDQYPLGTESITIQVENRGDYRGELNRPYLEVERSGKWYILPKNTQEPEPANLLFVYPGEPQEWEVYLGAYDMAPGKYRAVFDYWSNDGYFAFTFEIVEAE